MNTTTVAAPELLESHHFYSVGALGLVTLLFFVVSNLRDPISKVPGPWYTKWTGFVADCYSVVGRKPAYIHNLHQKYGPIVRIRPQEVYIQDVDAAQQIFKIKNEFPKAKWYSDFIPFGQSVFSTRDIQMHRRLRRLLSSPLSESGLKQFQPQIEQKVNLAIERMGEEAKTRGAVDIFKWWLFMTTDVIGELSFGESFRMLESGKVNQYIEDLQSAGELAAYRTAFPRLYRFCVRLGITLPYLGKAEGGRKRIFGYAATSLKRHMDLVEKEGPDARPTVFTKVYKAQGEESISPQEVVFNAQSYIVAGSDTTSNTLSYLVWAVCHHPEVKARLLKELDALPDDFSYEDLQHVSYLDHVIDETLRRYPAVPAGIPRQVPEGGTELCGYNIPAGYTVAVQNHTIQRDPVAFPNPDAFDPLRWEHPTPAMKNAFMAFGGGSRICIGLHLARMELRLGVAQFFKTFPNARMSTKEGMSEQDMNPILFFLLTPQGHRCLMDLD
ncbi:cytochrome P450 [Astrocystis sublimbata]|nr:cytochrome P450 [Astrocystis sublimbata]